MCINCGDSGRSLPSNQWITGSVPEPCALVVVLPAIFWLLLFSLTLKKSLYPILTSDIFNLSELLEITYYFLTIFLL